MSNKTPFQVVMEEVLEHGQRSEALGFKVLSAMIDMETTFHKEWLQDYFIHKNTRGYQADRIREVLTDLLGETYSKIIEESQLSAKETKTDPQLGLRKQLAQKKRINLDNRVRSCIEALVFFRVNPLNSKGLSVNNLNKTASFVTGAGDSYRNLTFTDVQEMSKAVAAEQNWIPKPKEKENGPVKAIVKDGKPVGVAENSDKLLVATLQATTDLINRTEHPSMSVEAVKAMIVLARTALKKQFANSKGQIDLEDLELDFKGVFVTNERKAA